MKSYTERMEDAYWGDKYDLHEDMEFAEILSFLNGENFRSFTDGLISVIAKKYPEDTMTPIQRVKQSCKDKEIDVNEIASVNTLKSWFNGGERPKKGEDSRRKMFLLAFALGLNLQETQYLMTRVLLDRAFNFRNYQELIFYYCISNSISYQTAKTLIERVVFSSSEDSDKTLYTDAMVSSVNTLNEKEELLSYINSHPHNFTINNHTAQEELTRLISQAKQSARQELTLDEYVDDVDNQNKPEDLTINCLFEHITSQRMNKTQGTSSIFKNAELPKEIRINFPEASSFTKKDPTSDELRKMIIILFSYDYWCHVQYPSLFHLSSSLVFDFDDYIVQLDSLLFTCGLPQMYAGNPHDWMYCYCAASFAPLDSFRQILSDALWSEEDNDSI